MLKATILTIPFLFMGNVDLSSGVRSSQQAEIDFSQLSSSARHPKIEEIHSKFLKFRRSIHYKKLSKEQGEALTELERSFVSITIPPTLKLAYEENLPEWGAQVNSIFMSELEKNKVEETLEKLSEDSNRAQVIEYCGFVDPGRIKADAGEDVMKMVELKVFADKYQLRWNKVIDVKENSIIGYAIYLAVPTQGFNLEENERKDCHLPITSWALKLNKQVEGEEEVPPFGWMKSAPPVNMMK